jgi:uncharacterized protein (TIGR03435 family)
MPEQQWWDREIRLSSGRSLSGLKWNPNDVTAGTPPGAPSLAERPSLFTALEDNLGVKLEPTRGPVDVLVIDHVEKPSSD